MPASTDFSSVKSVTAVLNKSVGLAVSLAVADPLVDGSPSRLSTSAHSQPRPELLVALVISTTSLPGAA